MRRVKAVWWGSTAAVLGSVTLGWFVQLMWRTWRWDPREDCAIELALPWEEIGVAADVFPPQLTCVGGDRVTFANPLWTGQLLVVGVTVVIICALVSRWYRQERAAKRAVAVIVTCAVVAALGVAGVIGAGDPRPRVESARQDIQPPVQKPWLSGPAPTASSTPAAPVSAAKARAALTELGRSARRAGGEGLLWPKRPVISSEQCEDGTQPGTRFLLTARFTTRDMDDVHGPSEVLQVSQANERVAARIVDAWLAGDLLTGVEPLHGEWYFTMPAGSPLYTAHVGFTDAIGELRVLSQCAVLP